VNETLAAVFTQLFTWQNIGIMAFSSILLGILYGLLLYHVDSQRMRKIGYLLLSDDLAPSFKHRYVYRDHIQTRGNVELDASKYHIITFYAQKSVIQNFVIMYNQMLEHHELDDMSTCDVLVVCENASAETETAGQ